MLLLHSPKDIPVENPSAHKSRAFTHHPEQDLFPLLADHGHVLQVNYDRHFLRRSPDVVPLLGELFYPGRGQLSFQNQTKSSVRLHARDFQHGIFEGRSLDIMNPPQAFRSPSLKGNSLTN